MPSIPTAPNLLPPPPRHLALILHAHLPFVRHPEHARFLEEDWFFEALSETYLPLLDVLTRLEHDGITQFQITLSLTPTLCAMMRDPLLSERFVDYLERTILLADDDIGRNRALGQPQRRRLARFYRDRLQQIENLFSNHHRKNLLDNFRHFQDLGVLEIAASAATHAILPLHLAPPGIAKAQIQVGVQAYRECFDCDPAGFWLPECAYSPELDLPLQDAGIQWTVLESHGLYHGNPTPANSVFKPCRTPTGVAVFGRDPESSRQVWSADQGYPGNPAYREFYRDLGHELPLENLLEYLDGDDDRRFTGLKYHRITDRESDDKDLYDPEAAAEMARSHAAHFVTHRATQLAELAPRIDGESIVVCAFDAELFGHWWFEGPLFLEEIIRQTVSRNADENTRAPFRLTSPSKYLDHNLWLERIEPAPSTWGMNGYLESWLSEENAWIYPHLHHAARELENAASTAASSNQQPTTTNQELRQHCLQQLARELFLAQSSDWAFLLKTGTATEYATKRTRDHLFRFAQLLEQYQRNLIDEPFLSACQARTPLFPDLDWRLFAAEPPPLSPQDQPARSPAPHVNSESSHRVH